MQRSHVLTYLHGDHLGSTVLETDYDGNRRSTQTHFAFGARRGGTALTPATENQYTGQKLDGTGMYYYNARTQRVPDDPALGQFVSPDTLVPDESRVRDWNRYAYARGNPLKYNDPSGHEVCQGTGGDCTQGDSSYSVEQLKEEWRNGLGGYFAFAEYLNFRAQYLSYQSNPNILLSDLLVRNEAVQGNSEIAARNLFEAQAYSEYYLGESVEFLFHSAGVAEAAQNKIVIAEAAGDNATLGALAILGFHNLVATSGGQLIPVPDNWVARVADNGRGIVYQRPGATGNADMVRIMEPTARYPQGYVRFYNSYGQPLGINGKPGSRADTHIPLNYSGEIKQWP